MTNVKVLKDEQRRVLGKGSPFHMVLIKRFITYNQFSWLHDLGAVKTAHTGNDITGVCVVLFSPLARTSSTVSSVEQR